MRAVVQDRYGPPEVLRVADVARPVPAEGEVLVRVHASTVTRGDAGRVRFEDYRFARVFTGIRRPRRPSFGSEFAGRVDEIGAAVTEFRVGDDVFGVAGGANAELVAVREGGVIAPKPAALTFEEAAAIPDGSLLALSCLRPAEPFVGRRVLVYGAAGSVGTAAVQLLLHHFGAAGVTAVCDTKDVERVRSLGAHDVIDRLREDFTKNGKTYDVSSTRSASTRSADAGARSNPAGSTCPWTSGTSTTSPSSLSPPGSSGASEQPSGSAAIGRRTSVWSRGWSTRARIGRSSTEGTSWTRSSRRSATSRRVRRPATS